MHAVTRYDSTNLRRQAKLLLMQCTYMLHEGHSQSLKLTYTRKIQFSQNVYKRIVWMEILGQCLKFKL
jgi:hypothetical protein